ncbi:MAG: DNA helicase RecQ [Ignavibacteriaceae bacterium]|nr:DNA helicase RecQ [Ignavibacteriaceae bacterium]
MTPIHILKKVFGYEKFRPLQQEIIDHILEKKDTLVIMPTGVGKSICYQIPALIFDGLTIVVSPLISLMTDQVQQLRQLGVNAVILNSAITTSEYQLNLKKIVSGESKILYIAPESLLKEEIQTILLSIKVDCLTIDEAHCISEWGHDFRPEYRQLGQLRKKFNDAVVVGLTATATPRVQDDIQKSLNFSKSSKFIASFNRENLLLRVIIRTDPLQQTLAFLKNYENQSGIIYCFSRKQVDTLAEQLNAYGYSARPYHAGLSDSERHKNQDLFIKDKVQIVVATIAFGMGINKSNVRFVLHYNLPKNLESYYQEIGRSGRDGLTSECLLLFSYSDINKIQYFIEQKENELERTVAKKHLQAMVKFCESTVCRRIPLINYFGEEFNTENCGMCDVCLSKQNELQDLTIKAQMFLSAVKRTGEIFGATHVIDVLTGSKSEKVLSNKHNKLSVYGVGKETSKKEWMVISQHLINKSLLIRDEEFGSLRLTEKSAAVLQKKEKVFAKIQVQEESFKKIKEPDQAYDTKLFEILRKKRKELAEAQDIPPYMIFSDKVIAHMATYFPQNQKEMMNISGVGEVKFQQYGKIFLALIKLYCVEYKITGQREQIKLQKIKERAETKPRHIEIGDAFNDGLSINDLVKKFDIKQGTILSHLYKYLLEGFDLRVDGLQKLSKVTQDVQKKIFTEFSREGTDKLKPIFDKYNDVVSYDDLHLLRIIYLTH